MTVTAFITLILFVLLLIDYSTCFNSIASVSRNNKVTLSMHFEESTLLAKDDTLIKGREYIATNRFVVRANKDAKFEERWAKRQSKLATLEGFEFFALLRKISENNIDDKEDIFNYISCTFWGNKDNFDAWKNGEAFKEAHGGGSITDFIKLISTALFILKGSPKPAFYDSILQVKVDSTLNELKSSLNINNGWRQVDSNGIDLLQPDVYASIKKYTIKDGREMTFEKIVTSSSSKYSNENGLISYNILRRNADNTYSELLLWKNKNLYDESTYKSSHKDDQTYSDLFKSNPTLSFYEGKLTLVK